MTFMVWNEHLETGIDIVDRQHRGLVDMLNQAAPLLAASSRESMRDIGPLLDGLLDYAGTHFRTEEELMARGWTWIRAPVRITMNRMLISHGK
jgi:hemerythrin-like metal-binding protein